MRFASAREASNDFLFRSQARNQAGCFWNGSEHEISATFLMHDESIRYHLPPAAIDKYSCMHTRMHSMRIHIMHAAIIPTHLSSN
jgi:hypothetical protein